MQHGQLEDTHYIDQVYQCNDCGATYSESELPNRYCAIGKTYVYRCYCGSSNITLVGSRV